MGLRLFLAGFVASMGFNLPTREWMDGLSRVGHSWMLGSLEDWNALPPTCEEMCEADWARPATAAPAPRVMVSDEAFGDIVEGMTTSWAGEAAPSEAKALGLGGSCSAKVAARGAETGVACDAVQIAPGEPAEPVAAPAAAPVVVELIEIPADLYPGLAYALNREHEGFAPQRSQRRAEVAALPPAPEADELLEAEEALPEPFVPRDATLTLIRVVEEEPETPEAAPTNVRGLAQALRLTGQALQAWATFLEGPAVVSLRP